MIKLLTIIGARPQIIKAAAISRAIRTRFAGEVEEHILHTGQHYDANMSEVFFRELGIPEPDYNLHVGSGSHGIQTAKMIEGVEAVLTGERVSGLGVSGEKHSYDGIIVYGMENTPGYVITKDTDDFGLTERKSTALYRIPAVAYFYLIGRDQANDVAE